jgi:transcriptional/translational regulatory protein YebC/TACO1
VISNEKISLEELENDAIEFGAEDVEQFDEFFKLTCAPNDFSDVLWKLKEKYQIEHSKVEQVPKIYVEVNKRDKGYLKLLLQALESSPSVLAVYHNADF